MSDDIKISDTSAIELLFTKIAKVGNPPVLPLCSKYGIKPEHFDIHLVDSLHGADMRVIPGGIVQIVILWQYDLKRVMVQLESAFRLMQKHHLKRALEIVPFSYARGEKKWFREQFMDVSEFLDILPKHRIRVTTMTTVTYMDVISGEKVERMEISKPTRFDGDDVGSWIELSRKAAYTSEPDDDKREEIGT